MPAAAALPQVLAPVIAADLGGYSILSTVAACFAALGAVLVKNIRGVT